MRNFDPRGTIRANLAHWVPARRQLVIERPLFWSRQRRHGEQWQIIVAVDQSGSMVGSVIHAAVTAACLCGLPAVKLNLIAFDTAVVDLSTHLTDPVETLMKVQLGGGTDIAMAVNYCGGLVREPARSIIVLITDFFEGGDEGRLIRTVRDLSDAGVRMIGLGALGYDARPAYNKTTAGKCRKVGMDILVCTPERLAEAMAEIIKG